MTPDTVEDEFVYYTTKAGEIIRQLGLAGLAAVWLFNRLADSTTTQVHVVPRTFRYAVILIVAALAIDAFQYVVGSLLWGAKVLTKKGADSAANHLATIVVMLVFVFIKVAVIACAYSFLLCALATQVRWG